MDLMVQTNTVPPRTPMITVVWNQHLPGYDPTCVNQEFKAFDCLPDDLVFKIWLSHRLAVMIDDDPTIRALSMFPDWNSSLLQENVKKRQNDEPRKANAFDR